MMYLLPYRFLVLILLLTTSLGAFSQNDVEVTVDVPGTLAEQVLLISPDAQDEITSLKVNGNIDGNDMMFIRQLCGVKNIATPVEGKLTHLDLADASIVATDKPYLSLYGEDLTTKDGIFGPCFLYNCRQLESLTLPSSILAVDSFALASCSALKEIDLPYTLRYIGYGALVGCASVESLTIPNQVDSIAIGALQKMTALHELTLGDAMTGIDNSLILGCDSLKIINCGASFRDFHPIVFYTAPALEEINVVGVNPYLSSDEGVLYSLNKDTLLLFPPASTISEFNIPEGVRSVGHSAFYGAKKLTNLTMPESLLSIDSLAFFNCTSLSQVALGPHTEVVAFGAFGTTPDAAEQPSLAPHAPLTSQRSITIPPSVAVIEDGAFFCGHWAVSVDDDNPNYASDDSGCLYNKYLTRLCYAQGETELQLPNTVTDIGGFALAGCQLPTVYIPDHVTSIGDGAFAYATGMESLSLGTGATFLGDMLVEGCQNLKAVYVFADNFDFESIPEFAFLDNEGSVMEQCTLYVKPGLTDYFLTMPGFYSEEYEMFFFADIQEMEQPDGISAITAGNGSKTRIFSLDGKQHKGLHRGMNIIKLPEGRLLKRFLK